MRPAGRPDFSARFVPCESSSVTTDPITAVRSPRETLAGTAELVTVERRPYPGITLSIEAIAWAAVILVAALFRLMDLGIRQLRPQEALPARAALEFSTGALSPDWLGDLTSGLTVLTFRVFGDSDTTARLAPALLGAVAVACLALYRPLLGRGAALIGALLVAISPVAVASARSFGPEAAALPLALLMPPLAWQAFILRRRSAMPLLALVTGLGLGTGALVPAMIVILVCWLAVELSWLDGRSSPAQTDHQPWDRQTILLSALSLLPGLLLALTRYGAGFDRLTLSSVRAWEIPQPIVTPQLPWQWVPSVLFAYEPLVTALGIAGAVLVLRRWTSPEAFGGRLLLLWTGAGLAINLFWLRSDPAHLLLTTVPLAMLAGTATAAGSRCLVSNRVHRLAIIFIPLVAALGFALVKLVGWGNFQRIPADEAAAVAVVVIGGVVAAVALVRLLRVPPVAALLLFAWLFLGMLTLHATANVAYNDGSEFVFGRRSLPSIAAIDRRLNFVADPSEAVAVERRVWPALAWTLRDRPVSTFVESPPSHPAVVPAPIQSVSDPSQLQRVPITEQWLPSEWDLIGILRWWIFRTPWGPVTIQQAEVAP
jgi:4-amino-4-deoxy-L-arabinose transferase-like glycosyltransferase